MQLLSTNFISTSNVVSLSALKSKKPSPPLLKTPNTLKPQSSLSELQTETLTVLEWPALSRQLTSFTSTSMACSLTETASIPIGTTREESQKLLDQTGAALAAIGRSGRALDLSGVEDITGILESAVSGRLVTIGELCAIRRTLGAAREAFQMLVEDGGDCSDRYSPLLDIFESCNFQTELEQKIGFCIDCNLSVILDRASEELEFIRSERKKNMEILDALLKQISTQIFQAGGIDKPLVTTRRSRLCVGVRASHRHLVPDGVVLDVSSSGATYFMEPADAVELNNQEVMLRDSEKDEEVAILSLLTLEIAELECDIKYLLDRVVQVDLSFARAAHAQWIGGVCPSWATEEHEVISSGATDQVLSVDIEGILHPLFLEKSGRSSSNVLQSNTRKSVDSDDGNDQIVANDFATSFNEFPVPIDIKVECGTRVVVISGPNTGGKTASMKTLGIASLMSKAGLYLPAKHHPRLPWFNLVLADIGDHQSLEHNLSTFSGHISWICKILEVVSVDSLVLIDEICSGTDPSEGVALATSILQYLKDRVNLAVVTTHYADLSLLKEKDTQFQNAAMEFSLETLKPTYQVLWGSTGDSNALSIAKLIGFDGRIIERAKMWVEKLRPEKQQERKDLLYESLLEERNRLEAEARKASSLHAEIMELYREIQDEAEDLERREKALIAKETQQVQQELETANLQIQTLLKDFEKQLRTARTDQFKSLIKNSEAAIASIVESHQPVESLPAREPDMNSYTPKFGEQVLIKGLGNKLATVVEATGEDDKILVQYGKVRVRVKKSDISAIPGHSGGIAAGSVTALKRQRRQLHSEENKVQQVSYGPRVQTSKNTVDLRGMRVEEAALHLDMAISSREPNSVIFVVHGMGTGAIKQCALDILGKHPRVVKYEPESPMNFGSTVAYID